MHLLEITATEPVHSVCMCCYLFSVRMGFLYLALINLIPLHIYKNYSHSVEQHILHWSHPAGTSSHIPRIVEYKNPNLLNQEHAFIIQYFLYISIFVGFRSCELCCLVCDFYISLYVNKSAFSICIIYIHFHHIKIFSFHKWEFLLGHSRMFFTFAFHFAILPSFIEFSRRYLEHFKYKSIDTKL